jgi:hypothetical protein
MRKLINSETCPGKPELGIIIINKEEELCTPLLPALISTQLSTQ